MHKYDGILPLSGNGFLPPPTHPWWELPLYLVIGLALCLLIFGNPKKDTDN